MASTSLNWNFDKKRKNVDISRFLAHNVWKMVEMKFSRKKLTMLEDGLEADITLMASGGSVESHRSVLAAVSPVFSAMFQHEWKGKDTTVDISDMSNEALQLLLIFFYADDKSDMSAFDAAVDEHFVELFEACHKYLVKSVLVSVLNRALPRNLTPENCWYYYHRNTSLQCKLQLDMPAYSKCPAAACKKYILNNFDKILGSRSIISEMKRNTDIVRVFMKVAQAKATGRRGTKRGRPKDDWWNYVSVPLDDFQMEVD